MPTYTEKQKSDAVEQCSGHGVSLSEGKRRGLFKMSVSCLWWHCIRYGKQLPASKKIKEASARCDKTYRPVLYLANKENLTLGRAAKKLGVHPNTAYSWARRRGYDLPGHD